MERRNKMEKALAYLTAFGALLTVAALALFALGGSSFVPDLLRLAAGLALGSAAVMLLTRSPRSGRRVAALLLLFSVVGVLAVAASTVASASAGGGRGGIEFLAGLLGSVVAASVARLLGLGDPGRSGSQASRRRV